MDSLAYQRRNSQCQKDGLGKENGLSESGEGCWLTIVTGMHIMELVMTFLNCGGPYSLALLSRVADTIKTSANFPEGLLPMWCLIHV